MRSPGAAACCRCQKSSGRPQKRITIWRCSTEPLYLGRAKRLASTAQRIMLYAKERGCTFPGCTAPAYHSQVHHAVADWVDGGQTNITDETLACGTDNRRVKRGGWRTRKLTAAGALRGVRTGHRR